MYRYIKISCVVLVAGLLCDKLHAQMLYNNGCNLVITNGGILYVNGAVENATGLMSNAGHATIKGYFRNGSNATGGNAAGEYIVYGDWENNNNFTADQSVVRLTGNAQQITGSQSTTFYDLTLETQNAVKTQTIDATVGHVLALNDCELATGDNTMNVTSPAPAAITRGNGYVSSTGIGRLVRATNSTDAYLFPTGWYDNGNVLYRPAEIKPSVNDAQTFAVRMGWGDASVEGYDVNTKAGNVSAVNNRYFHLIKQSGSTAPSDLTLYFNAAADGDWNSIGRWQNIPEWEDLALTTLSSGNPLSGRTKALWNDNSQQPHILINSRELPHEYNFPNVFNPNSDHPENVTFHIINNTHLVTLQDLKIYNRWGEPVFDSQRDGVMEWDGKYQGKLQPMGNYVFMASVKINTTGEVKPASGNLSLLW